MAGYVQYAMPVVEPYPISEPLSTAGRINMNYQMTPVQLYQAQHRAARAVLKAEQMTVIPDNVAGIYKAGGGTSFGLLTTNNGHSANWDFRVPISNSNGNTDVPVFDNPISIITTTFSVPHRRSAAYAPTSPATMPPRRIPAFRHGIPPMPKHQQVLEWDAGQEW